MANIGKVVIIGTVLWWPWSTLAQWSSLAQCFGCHGQHWHNDHHWHSVLVVMDIIGTVDIIDTVFWLSWTSVAQCLVAMVNIGTMVIIGTVVNIGTVDIIGTVFWWPWSTLAQWFRGTKHWCFLWWWPAQALQQQCSCIQWHFYIGGLLRGDSNQIQPESEFHFGYLEKSVEQTIDLVQIYNESCVMKGTWKITNERYGSFDVFFVHMHKLLNKQFSFNQWKFILRVSRIKSILLTISSDAKSGFHFPLLFTWKPVEQTAYMIQNI